MPFALAAVLLLLQEASPVEKENVEARLRLWRPIITGRFSATSGGAPGTAIDMRGDLGVDPTPGALEATLSVDVIAWLKLSGHLWLGRFGANQIIDHDLFIDGSLFPAGSRIDSTFNIGELAIQAEYNLLLYEVPDFRFDLGILGGAEGIALSEKLTNSSSSPNLDQTRQFTLALPVAGLRTRIAVGDWFALEVWGRGMSFSGIQNASVTLIEAGAEVQLNVFQGFFVGAGWHLLRVNADFTPRNGEEVDFHFLLSGPYVEIGYRF